MIWYKFKFIGQQDWAFSSDKWGLGVNDYIVSVLEMESGNRLALCDEARQMVKNIAKRAAKGSTVILPQPMKALGWCVLLKEGHTPTPGWDVSTTTIVSCFLCFEDNTDLLVISAIDCSKLLLHECLYMSYLPHAYINWTSTLCLSLSSFHCYPFLVTFFANYVVEIQLSSYTEHFMNILRVSWAPWGFWAPWVSWSAWIPWLVPWIIWPPWPPWTPWVVSASASSMVSMCQRQMKVCGMMCLGYSRNLSKESWHSHLYSHIYPPSKWCLSMSIPGRTEKRTK